MNEHKAPLLDHLGELQRVIIWAGLGVLLSTLVSFCFCDQLLAILRLPMEKVLPQGFSFVVLSPQEYFFCELKVSLFSGMVLSSPWVIWQIWFFVAPGLYQGEKKIVLIFLFVASICFFMGIIFAYYLVFPPMFKFFISTLPGNITGMYSVGMLYSLAISIILAFGAVFQTPIIVFLLVLLNLVEIKLLRKSRSYVFVGAFIIGALLTPPDPLTQVMLAIPAYLLFESGIILASLFLKRQDRTNLAQE